MSVLRIKQQRSQEKRAKIVAAAVKVVGRKGAHAATLTDICREADVPLSSFYDYFENKTDLLASLPAATFAAFFAELDPLLASISDSIGKLRALYLGTLRYMVRHPNWARAFFLEIWPSTLVNEPRVREAVDRFGRKVIDIVEDGIASRELSRTNDSRLLMSIILGSMTHLVAVWVLYNRPYDLIAQGERSFEKLATLLIAAPQQGCSRVGIASP